AFHPHCELAATIHVAAIDDHCAGAAFAAITADLRAGQSQLVAQHFGQRAPVLHVHTIGFPVYLEIYRRSVFHTANHLRRVGFSGLTVQQTAGDYRRADGPAADAFEEIAPRYSLGAFWLFHDVTSCVNDSQCLETG